MIVQLSRKPNAIAWTFFVLIYTEILLSPLMARAIVPYPVWYAKADKFRPKATGQLLNTLARTKAVEKNFIPPVMPVVTPATKQRAAHANVSLSDIGGPGQPEMQAFSSVNGSNMVDLFSGNFNYSIPLLDVGGYPLALGYTAGVTMDQEASWVGLGWNINPGTISRNLRGLPDDFNGDPVTKTVNMKPNKTVGVTAGLDLEIAGFPKGTSAEAKKEDTSATYSGAQIGYSLGVTHNNYKGWGIEPGVNGGINVGKIGKGTLSAGLSLTSSSMEGLTVNPSISASLQSNEIQKGGSYGMTLSLPYNSRSGLQSLQMSIGESYKKQMEGKNRFEETYSSGSFQSSLISFYQPSVIPSINVPYTNSQFTFTGKVGLLKKVNHPSFSITGYVSRQYIAKEDVTRSIPAYGYLNMQHGAGNAGVLLDYNREKELPYREKPVYPHIAVPSYTYDAFSISGEGTGGMFRAYRSEIGLVHDHFMKTRSNSAKGGIDIGVGDVVHIGADVGITLSDTRTGPWSNMNPVANVIGFRKKEGLHEASYFRNPGEKSINSKQFYNAIGGDDVVAVHLHQYNNNSSNTQAVPILDRFKNGNFIGDIPINKEMAAKPERDKRTQVISYLTASEADVAGLSKYIENFKPNVFDPSICGQVQVPFEGNGTGLRVEKFPNKELKGNPSFVKDNEAIWHPGTRNPPFDNQDDHFSMRWTGRIKAPVTGTYNFKLEGDDGFRLKINGQTIIEDWRRGGTRPASGAVNLVAGEFYDIVTEMYEHNAEYSTMLSWGIPVADHSTVSGPFVPVPITALYGKPVDTYDINTTTSPVTTLLTKEKRVKDYRKAHHLSEITVLNADGRRYVYGIPVYNLIQKDVTFSANGKELGNMDAGLVKFGGDDNTPNNRQGRDWYFSQEETPAYAHSFLLTAIVSDDYSDLTGNGISEDDPGTAVKINYSRLSGFQTPFKWRAPFNGKDSATFNEGLRTDYRDDKATYSYGEKELWYMHSVESKTMIATFMTSRREDMPAVDEKGNKDFTAPSRKLDSIHLYNKSDFAKNGTAAIPIKTVHFEYVYDLCKNIKDAGTGKLTLKRVWFTYNGIRQPKEKSTPYVFNYHSNNPSYNSQYSDRWGTYKSALQNPGSTASKPIRNAEYPYALQDSTVAAFNAGAWNLDSINLPSGGSMKIDYESDDYGFVQNKSATQMFKLAGLGFNSDYSKAKPAMYAALPSGKNDYLYVFVKVPYAVASTQDVYNLYLQGLEKIYFKTFVKVPKDNYNNGQTHEYVPCYARIEKGNYGFSASDVIWFKLESIDLNGNTGGGYSPLVKAATQFLRLNLPSKAYPGSETGDDLDLAEAIQMLSTVARNVSEAMRSFDRIARNNNWMNEIDLNKSFVRLNNPQRKKYGGGHRVKRITIYDNWDKMTNQRPAKYGQEYIYTAEELVNGKKTLISSGVAEYEPAIGGDENPLRLPIEYIDQPSVLAPVTSGYTEEPLGESFFPSPGVGYSKVRVRTINYLKKKSANGFDETRFYTARDYPIFTDRSLIDAFTRKRYRPSISNFLRINSYHFLSISQGFKVELNDMHGKLRAKASYAETDPNNYINYQEYFYRTDNSIQGKRLSNTVMAIHPDGKIDTTALIGKDVELMVDMREQESVVISTNIPINVDAFTVGFPPFIFPLPSAINMYQREKNLYRSVGASKVIRRYGILDSVIAIDKGSRISTKDVLYDSETGDVLLTRTQNEFDDYVYNLNYPSHWAYPSMSGAYKNIDVYLEGMTIRGGKLTNSNATIDNMFCSGDEVLVGGKERTGGSACNEVIANWPTYAKVWCIDSSEVNGGTKSLYFIDRNGRPFSGFDVSMRIVRSGRRNIYASVGSLTSLKDLLKKDAGGNYGLVVDENSKVLAAQANEFSQLRKVEDMKRLKRDTVYPQICPPGYTYAPEISSCVKDTAAIVGNYFQVCLMPSVDESYSTCGSFIYSGFNVNNTAFTRSPLPYNAFWANDTYRSVYCNYTPRTSQTLRAMKTGKGLLNQDSSGAQDSLKRQYLQRNSLAAATINGPMGRVGVWSCNPASVPVQQWFGFTVPVFIPHDNTYYLGMAADNVIRITIDGQLFREDLNGSDNENFKIWHIFPKYLTKGVHTFKIEGKNSGGATGLGFEIYDNTEAQLRAATSYSQLKIILSTKDMHNVSYPESYSCPVGYSLDKNSAGNFVCRKYATPNTVPVYTSSCRSIVNDTIFNPYVIGALGVWKNKKVYTYYGNRAEENPAVATNIRQDGALKDFAPYWTFQQSKLKASTDTVKWVWNSEATLFNRKGMELENKDPLGRFNSGIYGYDQTLPIAITRNSQYREAAFEGFEDYHATTTNCSQDCTPTRHFDFSAYAGQMDVTEKHTGNRSLKLLPGQQAGITAVLSRITNDTTTPKFRFTKANVTCVTNPLEKVTTDKNILLPNFSPTPGKKLLVSVWVKEMQDCKCSTYVNNRVAIVVKGPGSIETSLQMAPSGSIIEGWQRYEIPVDVSDQATSITVGMQATGNTTVFFDDLRIHPYNANMKSFVFHPVNLRLMAELDENNYATFYEYDDEGTLIRLKKETQRGIKTIKETRSSQVK